MGRITQLAGFQARHGKLHRLFQHLVQGGLGIGSENPIPIVIRQHPYIVIFMRVFYVPALHPLLLVWARVWSGYQN